VSYDEQPDGDLHGECAAEIHRLEAEIERLRAALLAHAAQADRDAPVELPEPDGELEPNGQGFEFLANELFDGGGPIFSPSTLRTYGDAREAAGYARGLAVASRWGA